MCKIKYIYERRDFVALTRALIKRPLWQIALKLFFASLIAGHIFVVGWLVGGTDRLPPDYMSFYFYFSPLLFAPLFFVLFGDYIAGLNAALIFKRNASANKEISFELLEHGFIASSDDIRSELSWASITKVIETDHHLFLAISRREALTLPKRAFASETDFARTMDFVRNHVSPQTPIVKHTRFQIIDVKAP
ncbi:YcxB family protein [Agrobacterium larrymoorei]|uniref:YcxB family protein n=1 Tax=Agrobacterium larrymoorei TaxID=160699 RepID=UPI001574DD41|nr:YcxB family protein [Agrobacterium larrymoorei]NTJ41689.1 YcxB family protein [Agrobacterium larrymoorei]